MPPGRAIAEALWGRSGALGKLFNGSKTAATRNAVRHQATVAPSPAAAPHAVRAAVDATATSPSGSLVDAIVNVAKTLTRAPGQLQASTRRALHTSTIYNNAGRRYISNVGTGRANATARSSGGGLTFGNLRPNLAPPRIMGNSPNLGLGTARNFSYSSRNVFENVVQNAPLGLRVLGDDYRDRLDMTRFRREMKRAHCKARNKEMASKGKGKMVPISAKGSSWIAGSPSAFETYFPVSASENNETQQASVQLVLPLNPVGPSTSCLSTTASLTIEEETGETGLSGCYSLDEDRIFSPLLMSDLRSLSDLYGTHQARIRNLLSKLEMAGCFDEPEGDVRAVLDEVGQRIIITFYGRDRWTLKDVRQVLGIYSSDRLGRRSTWYTLVDLTTLEEGGEASELSSIASSEIGEEDLELLGSTVDMASTHPTISAPQSVYDITGIDMQAEGSVAEAEDYDRVSASLRLPILDVSHSTASTEYVWGVEDFISSLSTSHRPTF